MKPMKAAALPYSVAGRPVGGAESESGRALVSAVSPFTETVVQSLFGVVRDKNNH